MSLKQRLLLLVLGVVTLVWLGAAAFTWHDARHELSEVLDAHLAQAATLLIAQYSGEMDDGEDEHRRKGRPRHHFDHQLPLHPYSRQVAFQIWKNDHKLLHSPNAPNEPLATQWDGFSESLVSGQRWRVFASPVRSDDDDELVILVAERMDVREQLAGGIIHNLLKPLLVALPLLGILLWLAVRASLRPLVGLTQAVAQRKPDNLSPLPLQAPAEVVPLIERLNQLFTRTGSLIENERRFTADAAHELRTPVAAIKAQVQVAQGAVQADERSHALNKAVQGCNRATHLIEQLLTLARLENANPAGLQVCDLRQMAGEVIAEMAAEALEQGVHLELNEGEAVTVRALPGLLAVLLRNVLDNAVRYGGAGTTVQVNVSRQDSHPLLLVCDDGAGLPAEELAQITRRFYRSLGNTASGSGLGLSIVQRIAEIHQADLQISAGVGGKGLCVRVGFTGS